MGEQTKPFLAEIDEKASLVGEISDFLYDHPETAFSEFQSAAFLKNALREQGFRVEENVGGLKTAFSGTFGHGKPIIGILGEFDALSGLSQQSGKTVKTEFPGVSCGQGCGHNFFGAGSFGAALGVKRYLEETGKDGTVIFYGTPAEEGGSGKGFMARAGAFDALDGAIAWHPSSATKVKENLSLANAQILYKFDGLASHAGAAPEAGRSALDALELMNVGVQFLREHMSSDCRVHYAITDPGGYSPNVVQAHAEVLYLIRAPRNDELKTLVERVDKIADGAALMTETKVSRRFIKACSNTIINRKLCIVMDEVARAIEVPHPTEEDIAFGKELTNNSLLEQPGADPERPFHEELRELTGMTEQGHGSTDVGDVSWVCPTVQINTATWAAGTPAHSWQVVTQGKREWGKRMTCYAAKVMAGTAIKMIEDPEILSEAWKEHKENVGPRGYECPIPNGVEPVLLSDLIKKS